jgi:hypothetical protein
MTLIWGFSLYLSIVLLRDSYTELMLNETSNIARFDSVIMG